MNKKTLLPALLVPSCVVMIPAAAMLLEVEGWAWSPADFIVMWLLLAAAIAAYQFVASKMPSRAYRAAAGLAVTTGVMLVWVNGAVGIIGSDGNPANALFGGVLLVGLVGAAIARLRPLGLAWTLFAMAAAQLLVPIIALILWPTDFSPGVAQVFGLNLGFVSLFAVAGLLFRHAGNTAGGANAATTV